ncbi:MAG: purine-nucleoside phosphorylase [Crocinitomicaceae bacterium]|nr:purine-nucleoside phosphorylase [Crocinitomicaceae bacterium]|tara:strand:- start:16560 stop:17375 length:816 start_codon:yes stop_codon:yes gene_type:complete
MNMKEIRQAADYIKKQGVLAPQVGIVLGTGLGKLLDSVDVELSIDYSDIPNFPLATVEFHQGKLVYGELFGKKILAMAGRFHYYEGYSMKQITLPIRVMKLLGVENLIISNAAGGINLNYDKSDLMLIDDHINLLPDNPLIGKNLDEQGPRFPDMSRPYSEKLNNLLETIATEKDINLRSGVYASVSGPNLETRAEYRYLGIIGADAVGMSTVPEVIVANHIGMPCCAISVITDLCDPDNLHPMDIEDIIQAASVGEQKLIILVKELLRKL